MKPIKFYILRYLLYWAWLIDGFIGIVSCGLYCPFLMLFVDRYFLRYNKPVVTVAYIPTHDDSPLTPPTDYEI